MPGDGPSLRSIVDRSQSEFIVVSSETEGCVYKIGRWMVENGLQNRRATFIDGTEMETYVDSETRETWRCRQSIERFMEHYAPVLSGKYVFIPYITCPWTPVLVHLFINALRQCNALGLIFYSPKDMPDCLSGVMCKETYISPYQFPNPVWKQRRDTHKLQSDPY